LFLTGGNGHNLQGLPGHRHPEHSACAPPADIPSTTVKTSEAASLAAVLLITVALAEMLFINVIFQIF
jgi:hypothetical protein